MCGNLMKSPRKNKIAKLPNNIDFLPKTVVLQLKKFSGQSKISEEVCIKI